mmetsp:Transcript_577/g.763  ORF Transcript_577/g.763 Transcript_577/m.763 type:complete len:195 (-) Transcript_577:71-655(-)
MDMGPKRGARGMRPRSQITITDDMEYERKCADEMRKLATPPPPVIKSALRTESQNPTMFDSLAQDRNSEANLPFVERNAIREYNVQLGISSNVFNGSKLSASDRKEAWSRNFEPVNFAQQEMMQKARVKEARMNRIATNRERIENYVNHQKSYDATNKGRSDSIRRQMQRYENAIQNNYITWSFPSAQTSRPFS